MALPISKPLHGKASRSRRQIDARAAMAIAEDYLLMKVGDLLGPAEPRFDASGRWVMAITVGNAIQGTLGVVGSIAVDATTGEVLFSEEERAKVEQRAWELARPPAR